MDVVKKVKIFKSFYKTIFYAGIAIGAIFSLLNLNLYGILGSILLVYLNEKVINWDMKRNKSNYYAMLVLSVVGILLFAIVMLAAFFYDYYYAGKGFNLAQNLVIILVGILVFAPPFVFLIQKDVRHYLRGEPAK